MSDTYTMYSIVTYTGDGTTTNFGVSFPYLYVDDVHVTVDGVEQTVYPVISTDNPPSPFEAHWYSDNTIRFMTAPDSGAVVKIWRDTNRETAEVEFTNSAILTDEDLNTEVTQLLYIVQEAYDYFHTVGYDEILELIEDFNENALPYVKLVASDFMGTLEGNFDHDFGIATVDDTTIKIPTGGAITKCADNMADINLIADKIRSGEI